MEMGGSLADPFTGAVTMGAFRVMVKGMVVNNSWKG
jgi:hypothetical protein